MRAASSVSPQRVRRPRSGGNTVSATGKAKFGAVVHGAGSGLKNLALPMRPQSASAASDRSGNFAKQQEGKSKEGNSLSPTFDEYIFQARQELLDRRSSLVLPGSDADSVDPRDRQAERGSMEEVDGPGAETLVMPTLAPPSPTRFNQDGSSDDIKVSAAKGKMEESVLRRPSKADSEMTMSNDIEAQPALTVDTDAEKGGALKDSANQPQPSLQQASSEEEEEEEEELDAVDRLVEKLWNAIPWFIFTLVLIAGIPLFYVIDISLPLFLGVNLLTFLASITLVPAKIRRYAHPILTTSVATVFILWAIGAIRGWSLKRTLQSYSVDAKYTVLWSLSGYNGPVIGAGDVLFSTLDAGIVSLAIPMYRYRWDLWLHLIDMLVVLFPCSLLSLFVWPTVASSIGIAPERALAFASRFMSTPLAIELSLTIGADESITVVLVVITGIVISIFKDPFFRLFGLNPDQDGPPSSSSSNNDDGEQKEGGKGQDYLTIGIAMGSTAGNRRFQSDLQTRCMAIAPPYRLFCSARSCSSSQQSPRLWIRCECSFRRQSSLLPPRKGLFSSFLLQIDTLSLRLIHVLQCSDLS